MSNEYSWMIQALAETESENFYPRSYSGRGMYGKTCLGIVVRGGMNIGEVVAAWTDYIREDMRHNSNVRQNIDRLESLSNALGSMSWDNMGLDTIVYFTQVPWSEEFYDIFHGTETDDDDEDDSEE